MNDDLHTKPRIYQDLSLENSSEITLSPEVSHYLKNVLRKKEGDGVRLFNGREGEYLATITAISKKSVNAEITSKIKEQPTRTGRIHLLFSPIKKSRMAMLIEKAVELGVTDLHPVITGRTENRHLKEDRITAQIIEACEQCERLHLPTLHSVQTLSQKLEKWEKPLLWAAERQDASQLSTIKSENWAFLIGPEGGFESAERDMLQNHSHITPISLGQTIYRAETAAIFCLAHTQLQKTK